MLRHAALPLLLAVALPLCSLWADFSTEEANIARMTAGLLKQSHFASQTSGADLSTRFLDRYIDMFDPAKFYLTGEDLAAFASYRDNLAETTLDKGDITPAQKIFDRYLERLAQRVEFATNELATAKFDFSNGETYRYDRKDAQRPANLDEARALWRQHLRYEYLQEKLADKKPEEILATLTKRYQRTLKTMKQFDSHRVFETYLTALARVYDPHSDYMGRQQLEDFRINMRLSLFGIGAVLRSEDGYCKVVELMTGGPAESSKQLKPGDTIVAVAQDGADPVDVVEMPLRDIVAMIRGAKGTKVSLTIKPSDATDAAEQRVVTLVRDEIKLEKQEAKSRIVDMPDTDGKTTTRIGIIDLPSFYVGDTEQAGKEGAGCTADVARLIEKLKTEKVAGIIIDLRRNGGGSLEEAIKLSGLFIKTGPVVQTVSSGGIVNVLRDPDPTVLYDGPLVVLTSRVSASASEILAGAIQDYGRGLIVGDQSTFGKGTVQSVIQLGPIMEKQHLEGGEEPGALKLTIRKFYRPSGMSTQLKGVEPDLVIPSAMSQLKIGEDQMDAALPWDEIPPTSFTRVDRVITHLAALKKASATRMAADQEFQWLQEDMARIRERLDNPVVSLNEQKLRDETAADKAREKKRDEIRAARKADAETQYEITLRNAAKPGLPDPMPVAVSTNATASVSQPKDAIHGGGDKNADPDEEDEALPRVDPVLGEAKHILLDYIRTLNGHTDGVVQETR
jgi:carboxyl-terminal processing protease